MNNEYKYLPHKRYTECCATVRKKLATFSFIFPFWLYELSFYIEISYLFHNSITAIGVIFVQRAVRE